METLTKAEKNARAMVGDGKLPNRYFVILSPYFLTNKNNFKDEKISNCYDGSSEVYGESKLKCETFEFRTFKEARNKAEELANERIVSPSEHEEDDFHSVFIEDRLSGEIYNGTWIERWYLKKYRGETIQSVTWDWEWNDDTKYTR